MPTETKIEWCDFSSNPIRARRRDNGKGHWACVKVSAGCANCYAETFNKRFGTGLDYAAQNIKQLVEPYLDEREIDRLLKSRKLSGKRVFIGDMTDIFGEWVEDAWLDKLFGMFAARPDVTWIVLTKRAERMQEYITNAVELARMKETPWGPRRLLSGVWLGVSVENKETADERLPFLVKTLAAVRFISMEPLLGSVDLTRWIGGMEMGYHFRRYRGPDHKSRNKGIGWIIVGGESGPGARPCDIRWIESIVEQCRDRSVPIFVKQLGARPYEGHDERDGCCPRAHEHPGQHPLGRLDPDGITRPLCSPKGGDMAEWPEHLRVREFPGVKEVD